MGRNIHPANLSLEKYLLKLLGDMCLCGKLNLKKVIATFICLLLLPLSSNFPGLKRKTGLNNAMLISI